MQMKYVHAESLVHLRYVRCNNYITIFTIFSVDPLVNILRDFDEAGAAQGLHAVIGGLTAATTNVSLIEQAWLASRFGGDSPTANCVVLAKCTRELGG